jgi:hypothetical protein
MISLVVGNMCYFTITAEYKKDKGHKQELMIVDAEDDTKAIDQFCQTFGLPPSGSMTVLEGIHIEDGFADLVTAPIKKLILKYKSGNSDVSLVSYCNSIHTKYPEE